MYIYFVELQLVFVLLQKKTKKKEKMINLLTKCSLFIFWNALEVSLMITDHRLTKIMTRTLRNS